MSARTFRMVDADGDSVQMTEADLVPQGYNAKMALSASSLNVVVGVYFTREQALELRDFISTVLGDDS